MNDTAPAVKFHFYQFFEKLLVMRVSTKVGIEGFAIVFLVWMGEKFKKVQGRNSFFLLYI
jgi:hypothetical protein